MKMLSLPGWRLVRHFLKSSTASLARNTLFASITTGVYFVAGTGLYVVLGRLLSVSDYGTVMLAMAASTVMALLPNYGFNLFIIRELAQGKYNRAQILGNVFVVKLGLSLVALLLLQSYAALSESADQPLVFLVFGISVIVQSFSDFFNAILKADEYFQAESATAITQNLAQLALVLLVAVFLRLSPLSVAILILIGRSAALLVSFVLLKVAPGTNLRASLSCIRPAVAWKLTKDAFPFALQSALGVVYFQSDTLLIGEMLNVTSVGYYQAAMRLVLALNRVPSVLMSAFYPQIARDLDAGEVKEANLSTARLLIHVLFFIGLSLTLAFVLFASPIVISLYGQKMLPAVPILRILGIVFAVRFLASGYGLIVVSHRRQELQLLAAAVAVVLNIGLNLILIPRYGINAAAWVNLATNAVIMVFYGLFLRSQFGTTFLNNWDQTLKLVKERGRGLSAAFLEANRET